MVSSERVPRARFSLSARQPVGHLSLRCSRLDCNSNVFCEYDTGADEHSQFVLLCHLAGHRQTSIPGYSLDAWLDRNRANYPHDHFTYVEQCALRGYLPARYLTDAGAAPETLERVRQGGHVYAWVTPTITLESLR